MGGTGDSRYGVRAALLCAALAAVYVAVSAGTQLFDRDEPRFARAAVEMVDGGDYVVPRFNGNLRPDKPILIYWAMSVPVRVLGATASAVRLPSNVGMVVSVWLTFVIGRRMFGARAGFEAAAMFGTSVLCVWIGTTATADGLLIACMLGAVWPFVDRVYGGAKWWHWSVMAGALGLAQLAKGPVGLAVPVLTMIGAGWLLRRGEHRLPMRYWVAVVLACVVSVGVFAAWGLPAALATDWQIVREGLGKHVGERMVSAQEGHGAAGLVSYLVMLPLYVPLVLGCFFPWTLHLPGGVSALVRGHVGDGRDRAVLWGWIVPTFVLMSLVATKLPHYVLGIYPALAILCAGTLEAHRRGRLSNRDRDWLRGGIWFALPVGVAIVGALCAAYRWAGVLAIVFAAALVGVMVVVVRAQVREHTALSTRVTLAATCALAVLGVLVLAGPIERRVKISRTLAASARAAIADDSGAVDVAMSGYREPSLVFYMDRPADQPVRTLATTGEVLRAWAGESGAGVLVVWESDWAHADVSSDRVTSVGQAQVVNYSSSGRSESVLVLHRSAERP